MKPFVYFVPEKTGQRIMYDDNRDGTTARRYVDTYARRRYHGALNMKKVQCAVWRPADFGGGPYVEVTLDHGSTAYFYVEMDEAIRLFGMEFGPVE